MSNTTCGSNKDHAEHSFIAPGSKIVAGVGYDRTYCPGQGEPKTYYVTGTDFYGNKRTVKTEAFSPVGARNNSSFLLETRGTVRRG